MLKGYRKRFVLSNMALIGTVLLVVFIVLGVSQYRGAYNELRVTMRQVLEPLDAPTGNFRRLGDADGIRANELPGAFEVPESSSAPKGDDAPPQKTDGVPPKKPIEDFKKGKSSIDRKRIITVFFNAETQSLSIAQSETNMDDEAIAAAVAEILTHEQGFGRLGTYGLFYYMEPAQGGYKIALADISYLTTRVMQNALILGGSFLAAMGLFLLISIRLSSLAAKPLEQAMQMERQFVDDVSHDLKTPITVILANNSILKENQSETVASQRQWIDATDTAAKNMMHMIGEMLTLSSLESKQARVESVPFDLSAAAEKAVLQMESVAYERGVQMEDELAEGVAALGTAEFAERICNSLLENALKYEPDGGRVRVTLSAHKKHAVYTVQNFGSVISEEDLPHIFERFYRGDKTRSTTGGHGLGLPILRQIATLIGAEISVRSNADIGTVFSVSFAVANGSAKNAE